MKKDNNKDLILEEVSDDLAEKNKSQIRIAFNEYAIQKYGYSKKQLNTFYNKYDRAVKYYEKQNNNRKIWWNDAVNFSAVALPLNFVGALTGIIPVTFFAGVVTTTSLVVLGDLLNELFGSDKKYKLNRNNPYIPKKSIYHHMAKDYTEFNEQVLKKVR